MNTTALIFLTAVIPVAIAFGVVLVSSPATALRGMASISLRTVNRADAGSRAASSPLMHVHRRITGDPKTFWERAYSDPDEFRSILWALRFQGGLLLAWSAVAAALAVDALQ